MALKALGAIGIEKSFELMFIEIKLYMGKGEINKIIDDVCIINPITSQ